MKIKMIGLFFCLFLLLGAPLEAAEGDPWQFLWAQEGNGDQIYYRPEGITRLNTNQQGVIYQAELMSFWSIPMRNKIAEEMNLPDGVKEKFYRSEAGIAYQVEIDMTRWMYRISKVGYGESRKSGEITWTGPGRGEWRSLMGSEMGEPLATLTIRIYQERKEIHRRPSQPVENTSLAGTKVNLQLPWIELDQTSWGRYFFLPSEVKVVRSGEKDTEQFQVLVRSDWTLRARKEAPEAENAVRIQEKKKPIGGLDRTDRDYMIWGYDFSEQKRVYLSGMYLSEDGKVIHKEGNFESVEWTPWESAIIPGAVGAYLLANPEFNPSSGESWQVELPSFLTK